MAYALVAETSGILEKLNIEQFELVSLDSFESIFVQNNHDDIVDKCLKKWIEFRQKNSLSTYVPLKQMNFVRRPDAAGFPHLRQAFDKFFPTFKNPF